MMIKPATGPLAAMPASREELEALNQVLLEQLQDARTELHHWRRWGDAMPLRGTMETVATWMAQRPEPGNRPPGDDTLE